MPDLAVGVAPAVAALRVLVEVGPAHRKDQEEEEGEDPGAGGAPELRLMRNGGDQQTDSLLGRRHGQ